MILVNQDLTVTANYATPDFVITGPANPSSAIKAGGSIQVPIQINPSGGFNAVVTMTCTNLPTATSCTFDKNNVAVASATTITATISTAGAGGTNRRSDTQTVSSLHTAGLLALAALGLVICIPGKRKKTTLVVIAALAVTWTACGGGGGGGSYTPPPGGGGTKPVTPPGTYSVNIIATSGAITHTVVVTITVQ